MKLLFTSRRFISYRTSGSIELGKVLAFEAFMAYGVSQSGSDIRFFFIFNIKVAREPTLHIEYEVLSYGQLGKAWFCTHITLIRLSYSNWENNVDMRKRSKRTLSTCGKSGKTRQHS